jgi:hypothetical protein
MGSSGGGVFLKNAYGGGTLVLVLVIPFLFIYLCVK